jgi:hypothetical protein
VRQLEIRDPERPQRLYRIEDASGRWLGHATEALRFTAREPFQAEEVDRGVWSLERGVGILFGSAVPLRLQAVAIEAAATR